MSDPLTCYLFFQITYSLGQAKILYIPSSSSKQGETAKFACINHSSHVFITSQNVKEKITLRIQHKGKKGQVLNDFKVSQNL